MHVSSQRQGRRRPPLLAFLVPVLAVLSCTAHAVEFDEKLKAPMMKSAADVRLQAQAQGVKIAELEASAPMELITNASLARRQFDLKWQVQSAIDRHQPIEELADVGITPRGDGFYDIETKKNAQWDNLSQRIAEVLASRPHFESISRMLLQRGFRPEDVEKLKAYLASNEPSAASRAAKLSVALGLAKVVRKYDKLKQPVPDTVVLNYVYQKNAAAEEADRLWVEGLLKQFDVQRGRILLSLFLNELRNESVWWGPDDTSVVISETLAAVRRPDFEKLATAEAKGVAP